MLVDPGCRSSLFGSGDSDGTSSDRLTAFATIHLTSLFPNLRLAYDSKERVKEDVGKPRVLSVQINSVATNMSWMAFFESLRPLPLIVTTLPRYVVRPLALSSSSVAVLIDPL